MTNGIDTSPVRGAVLAAGYGSRMRPLTDALPKPLLPFLNTPIIAYTIDHLVKAGASDIGINLHHLGDLIPPVVDKLAAAWRSQSAPLSFTYVPEKEVRGTAGGIAGIWEAMGSPTDGTLIVINGDPVMNIDLRAELQRHREAGVDASIVVRPLTPGHPGRVWVDDTEKVCGLRTLRLGDGVEHEFMGIHILEPPALKQIAEIAQTQTSTCMVGDVYLPMLEQGKTIRATCVDDFWVALDNPTLLLDATRQALDNPGLFHQAPFGQAPDGRKLWIANPDNVHTKTMLAEPTFLGLYASTGSQSRVGPYAVIDGTELAPNCQVKRSIVFGMGQIEGEWEDCVAIQGKIAQL